MPASTARPHRLSADPSVSTWADVVGSLSGSAHAANPISASAIAVDRSRTFAGNEAEDVDATKKRPIQSPDRSLAFVPLALEPCAQCTMPASVQPCTIECDRVELLCSNTQYG